MAPHGVCMTTRGAAATRGVATSGGSPEKGIPAGDRDGEGRSWGVLRMVGAVTGGWGWAGMEGWGWVMREGMGRWEGWGPMGEQVGMVQVEVAGRPVGGGALRRDRWLLVQMLEGVSMGERSMGALSTGVQMVTMEDMAQDAVEVMLEGTAEGIGEGAEGIVEDIEGVTEEGTEEGMTEDMAADMVEGTEEGTEKGMAEDMVGMVDMAAVIMATGTKDQRSVSNLDEGILGKGSIVSPYTLKWGFDPAL